MPGLVPVIDAIDKVAEPLRPFYEQKDGKFQLIIDGTPNGFVPSVQLAEANGKVVEFRNTNTELMKEVEKLRPLGVALGDIDPVKAKDAYNKQVELEKKGIKGSDDIDAKIAAAVAAGIKPFQDQVATQATTIQAERARADASVLQAHISGVFGKVGGKANASEYIVTKAKDVFTVVNGKITALPNKFSTLNPSQPLTVEEWMAGMTKEADFAFAPTTGGGANPLTSTGAVVNPNQTVLKDPTPNQLGEQADAIKAGKVRVEYSQAATP